MTDADHVDNRRRQEAIEAMRKSAVPLPEGYKFNRDEIYDERFDSTVLGTSAQGIGNRIQFFGRQCCGLE
jgi:hypothetical protein